MADTEDLRRVVLALPGTAEGTHFRMPAFQVGGKNFIGVQKDGTVTMSMAAAQAVDIVAGDAAVTEIRRKDKIIGIQVDLASVSTSRLADLAEISWRHAVG
jgi:hypothetical protein